MGNEQASEWCQLGKITVRNKTDAEIKDVKVFFANGDKWSGGNNWISTSVIYATDWKWVDIHTNQNILDGTKQTVSLGNINSKEQKSTSGFRAKHTFRGYWDIQFTKSNARYKINKNNAQCNVWPMDENQEV
eukprot:786502_1